MLYNLFLPPRGAGRSGLTLIELMVVLAILVALSALVVPLVGSFAVNAREDSTWANLRQLQEVIVNHYVVDMRGVIEPGDDGLPRPDSSVQADRIIHPQLAFLFVNPATYEDGDPATSDRDVTFDPLTRRGWQGPYLVNRGYEYPGLRFDSVPDPGGNNDDQFTRRYGELGDPAILDGWMNPIVIQLKSNASGEEFFWALVSAGEDGKLGTADDLALPLQ